MRIKPIYIQLFGDAVIPVLGFFVWNWSLYFILLFYMLDLLVSEAFINIKTKRIGKEQKLDFTGKWMATAALSAILLALNIFLFHVGVSIIDPGINFYDAFIDFISYEELGIQQGYILIPLVVFMGYQQYKLEFLKPRRYIIESFLSLWRTHIIARVFILIASGLVIFIAQLTVLPEWIVLMGIVLLSALYQLFGAFPTKPAR